MLKHRIIATNSLLYKINIIDTNLCSFCADCEETIFHLHWECPFIVIFRQELIDFLVNSSVTPRSTSIDSINMSIFFGLKDDTCNQNSLLLHCLLLARYHIYRSRLRAIRSSLHSYLKDLRDNYVIEKKITSQQQTYSRFKKIGA